MMRARTRAAVLPALALALALGLPPGCNGGGAPAPPTATGRPSEAHPRKDFARMRDAMVRDQIESRGVRDPRVLGALRKVPREEFVPMELRDRACEDRPLPIGSGQTISQPFIVAEMTEAAKVEPGQKVLEIGTGSGYQAAVLAEITERVFSIELLPELGEAARARLDALGYGRVKTRIGDGYKGWPEEAPFDAILVTAAPPEVPKALVAQLAPGGRLVVPVGPDGDVQSLLRLTRRADGTVDRESLGDVRFVPMVPGK